MKAYTDLEQSRKLAEILSIESADMHWQYIEEDNGQLQWFCFPKDFSINQHNTILAWSLAALLSVLPKKYYSIKDHETDLILGKPKDKWCVLYWDATGMQQGEQTKADNPVDACYEMIVKLHEQELL